ncbi:FtsK/SpoIIIE domain-containing protein [Gordonia sputi]|uniref:FtsK/SpoIIIE domain-containing protein n=1 Tax=Gordonia sputi TaxID=36823 RepID=UPI0022713A43|nr:FtsK/SpoIIIE domain-containing protein [Gordonia sputi]
MTAPAVAFAVDAEGQEVFWRLDQHTLVAGVTGSGKSSATYEIIRGAAGMVNVRVCGVDPTGILLGPFAHHPWVAVGSSKSDLVAAIDTLSAIEAELDRRVTALSEVGLDAIPYSWLDRSLPSIVVVLEEYAALQMQLGRGERSEVERMVARIGMEGRKARINLLISVQRPEAKLLEGVRSQLTQIVCMAQTDVASIKMASEVLVEDRSLVTLILGAQAGQGVLVRPGMSPTPFRARLLDYEGYRRALAAAHGGRVG